MKSIPLGHKNFWIAQGIGWAIFAVVNITLQSILGLPTLLVLKNALYSVGAGIIVTTGYRYLIRNIDWPRQKLVPLILLILLFSFVLSVSWVITISLLFYLDYQRFLSPNDVVGNLINGSLVFLIWNLIYFFFQYFSKFQLAEVEKWQLKAEVKEAQLGSLKTQIRPHFMFNTLNNILALILEDKHKARAMLINFSELLRYSLQMSDASLVSLEEEIDMSKRYLQLLSIQYEDRLKYEIQMDKELSDTPIPPMMIQFLVENGVKHGIDQLPDGGHLFIDVRQESKKIILEVSNSGHLNGELKGNSSLGIGLKNIKERLNLIYKGKAKFNIRESNNLVIATIKIPDLP